MKFTTDFRQQIFKIFISAVLGFSLISTAQATKIDERIFTFQHKVAKNGNVKAAYKVAFMYEMGRGVEKDLNKAKQWYKKAVTSNFTAAKHRLTYLEIKQIGFQAKHRTWLKDAIKDADAGDDNVMFMLANMYEDGTGVKNDPELARRYYQHATAKGNADAEARLFRLEQNMIRIRAEKQKESALAAKKAKQKKEAKKDNEAEKKIAEAKRKQWLLQQAEKERKRLAAERKKLASEKRKLAAQKAELAKKQAAVKKAKAESEKQENIAKIEDTPATKEVFESDLCSGSAARFRTQCN